MSAAKAASVRTVASSEARTAVMTVGVVKARGFSSWWIEWLAKGGWSHCVALVLPGGMEVIDARANKIGNVPPGVRVRPISYLKDDTCLWLDIPCTQAQLQAAIAAATSVIGAKYDMRGIVDFATGQTDNSWKRKSAFFCSALGIWICWKAGLLGENVLVPFTNIDPGSALDVYWGLGARVTDPPAGLKVVA